MKRLALGVDGGGTKVDAILMDECGNVLGRGSGGSAHALYVGREVASESYMTAISQALDGYRPTSLWVAGVHQHRLDDLGIECQVHYVPAGEVSMGLAMALETRGILVLAGTGSFVCGITEDGRHMHLDGLGPILGDYGSGYWIGLRGLRAAMAATWSERRRTILSQILPTELGVGGLEGVFRMIYFEHAGRSEIASAAKTVMRAAEEGDRVAREIVLGVADDISDVLEDVIHGLGLEDSDCALVASGGIAQNGRLYWSRVCERALKIAPRLRPIQPKITPSCGAALLALKEMGIEWTPELLTNIEQSLAAFGGTRTS